MGKMDDSCSEASDLTSSTAATRSGTAISEPSESRGTKPPASSGPASRKLSEPEEKEARKYEKVLREISKIEARIAAGEQVDPKQLVKTKRKVEIEETVVMQKVRAGWQRFSAA